MSNVLPEMSITFDNSSSKVVALYGLNMLEGSGLDGTELRDLTKALQKGYWRELDVRTCRYTAH